MVVERDLGAHAERGRHHRRLSSVSAPLPSFRLLQDVGGEEKLRPYWRHYYTGTQGVLFVVDASDRERLPLAALELRTLANDEQLAEAVIAVAVNKTEAPGAMSLQEVQRSMDLAK